MLAHLLCRLWMFSSFQFTLLVCLYWEQDTHCSHSICVLCTEDDLFHLFLINIIRWLYVNNVYFSRAKSILLKLTVCIWSVVIQTHKCLHNQKCRFNLMSYVISIYTSVKRFLLVSISFPVICWCHIDFDVTTISCESVRLLRSLCTYFSHISSSANH